VTAVLATWLGLLVVTRARQVAGAPVFGLLCLLLVAWSVAIIIQRVGAETAVHPPVNLVEDAAAFLLPPVTTHIAVSVALEGRRSSIATAVLVIGYLLALGAIAQAAMDPAHPIQFGEPNFAPLGIPGSAVAWAFAGARLGVWAAGVGFLLHALSGAGTDRARGRQLLVAILTVVLGVAGGMLRILPEEVGGPRWVGVSLVAAAMVLATYAVVAQHVFLAAEVAGRAVRWSLVAGLGVVAYVGILVLLEEAAHELLGIDFPLVTALAVVVTLALFDPVADRLREISAGSSRSASTARLRKALGAGSLLAEPGTELRPALERLVRTFELTGAEVSFDQGPRARTGAVDESDALALRLPILDGEEVTGTALFGRKRNGLSFTSTDVDALELAVAYLRASVRLTQRHTEQAVALDALRAEGAAVRDRGSALREILAEASSPAAGLRVHALGSLRAELDGETVRSWGGAKAGSRQAEAIFAFLFDRGDRGASKDEIVELVWPDVDLDRADVAFHRTMLGLRSVLRPGRRTRGAGAPIAFTNDRYRLDPAVIAWSDVAEFDELLVRAAGAPEDEAIRLLEQARALYRGDYLDDCPFYGDSVHVEARRTELRGRYVDLLEELGARYTTRGDRTAASGALRQAQALAND